MVVGELMLRKFGAEHKVMTVECFQGIKSEELHRVIEKNYLGSSEPVIIHVDKNYFKQQEIYILYWEKYMLLWLRQRGNSELQTCLDWGVEA